MSGGIAYVLTEDVKAFKRKCNLEMILFESLEDEKEIQQIKAMLERHTAYTNSQKAEDLLDQWEDSVKNSSKSFRKTINKCSQASKSKKLQVYQMKKPSCSLLRPTRSQSRIQQHRDKTSGSTVRKGRGTWGNQLDLWRSNEKTCGAGPSHSLKGLERIFCSFFRRSIETARGAVYGLRYTVLPDRCGH